MNGQARSFTLCQTKIKHKLLDREFISDPQPVLPKQHRSRRLDADLFQLTITHTCVTPLFDGQRNAAPDIEIQIGIATQMLDYTSGGVKHVLGRVCINKMFGS